MITLGYKLSSEEQPAADLVRYAQMAQDTGFGFALISDHFHPWTDRQGQSPFVWSVLGAIAQATQRLVVGTAVTCPTMRIHPAIIAQAAATTATLMPGRFFLGVGTGENLNEHVVGQGWPETEVRQARLEEAIEIIRLLWKGGNQSYHGRYFTVENARLYSLPDSPPPLYVAVGGPRSADLAGRVGDGMIGTDPDASLLSAFDRAGGARKPRYAGADGVLGQGRGDGQAHRQGAVADLRHGEQPVVGAPPARTLRGRGRARHRGSGRGVHHLRPGSRASPRRHPQVRRGGLRSHLRPSGRQGPEGLLRVLRRGDPAATEVGDVAPAKEDIAQDSPLADLLGPCDVERVVDQGRDPLDETHRVWQAAVPIERLLIAPA